jgi:elongation factor P hydroxylase
MTTVVDIRISKRVKEEVMRYRENGLRRAAKELGEAFSSLTLEEIIEFIRSGRRDK